MKIDSSRWRFKKRDGLVYGPVPASVLSEQIAGGELDGETPVAPEEGAFRPLRELAQFQAELLRAQAARRVQADVDAAAARARRRRAVKVASWAAAGGAALAAVVGGAAWLATASAEIRAPEDPGSMGVTASAPMITTFAPRGPRAEDLIDYGARPPPVAAPGPEPRRPAPAPPPRAAPKVADARPPADPDGLRLGPRYDQAHINEVVRKNQASLFPCIAEEKRRSPDFAGSIPIEFTVQNDGRVGKLWIDSARFRKGPLQECLQRRLAEWRFNRYQGEQANVAFAFKVR